VINPFNLPIVVTADYIGVVKDEIDKIIHINGIQVGKIRKSIIDRNINNYYSL
jgi:hypothetical protein